ncbi:hypothetical protein [Salinibacter ruber]|uniref:hypothetical protein n=1 Tax=Salinibacter ruber TaxID=146919 RepID=UPI002169FBF4|nr:hypothetical protein [Salinibacter ruber]MCS3642393.1 hypothetical protein [Salinibacter ruber]
MNIKKVKKRAYEVHGVKLKSDIKIPEVGRYEKKEGNEETIEIEKKTIERRLKKVEKKRIFKAENGRVQYEAPEIGVVAVEKGKKIYIDVDSKKINTLTRLFILATGLATALYQGGKLVLHSSAVSIDGKAALFIGDKGAGKSTMAAAFSEKSHQAIADDAVRVDASTPSIAYPGVQAFKLRRDSLSLLDESRFYVKKIDKNLDKYLVSKREKNSNQKKQKIGGIFVIKEGKNIDIRECSFLDSFAEIVRHTYVRKNVRSSMGNRIDYFNQCTDVAAKVPVYELVRPKKYSKLDKLCELIKEATVQ